MAQQSQLYFPLVVKSVSYDKKSKKKHSNKQHCLSNALPNKYNLTMVGKENIIIIFSLKIITKAAKSNIKWR